MSVQGEITYQVSMKLSAYPTRCQDCPAFHTTPYICHNERGDVAHCAMGYMGGCDMRDFSGRTLFFRCRLRNDPRVTIAAPGSFEIEVGGV